MPSAWEQFWTENWWENSMWKRPVVPSTCARRWVYYYTIGCYTAVVKPIFFYGAVNKISYRKPFQNTTIPSRRNSLRLGKLLKYASRTSRTAKIMCKGIEGKHICFFLHGLAKDAFWPSDMSQLTSITCKPNGLSNDDVVHLLIILCTALT